MSSRTYRAAGLVTRDYFQYPVTRDILDEGLQSTSYWASSTYSSINDVLTDSDRGTSCIVYPYSWERPIIGYTTCYNWNPIAQNPILYDCEIYGQPTKYYWTTSCWKLSPTFSTIWDTVTNLEYRSFSSINKYLNSYYIQYKQRDERDYGVSYGRTQNDREYVSTTKSKYTLEKEVSTYSSFYYTLHGDGDQTVGRTYKKSFKTFGTSNSTYEYDQRRTISTSSKTQTSPFYTLSSYISFNGLIPIVKEVFSVIAWTNTIEYTSYAENYQYSTSMSVSKYTSLNTSYYVSNWGIDQVGFYNVYSIPEITKDYQIFLEKELYIKATTSFELSREYPRSNFLIFKRPIGFIENAKAYTTPDQTEYVKRRSNEFVIYTITYHSSAWSNVTVDIINGARVTITGWGTFTQTTYSQQHLTVLQTRIKPITRWAWSVDSPLNSQSVNDNVRTVDEITQNFERIVASEYTRKNTLYVATSMETTYYMNTQKTVVSRTTRKTITYIQTAFTYFASNGFLFDYIYEGPAYSIIGETYSRKYSLVRYGNQEGFGITARYTSSSNSYRNISQPEAYYYTHRTIENPFGNYISYTLVYHRDMVGSAYYNPVDQKMYKNWSMDNDLNIYKNYISGPYKLRPSVFWPLREENPIFLTEYGASELYAEQTIYYDYRNNTVKYVNANQDLNKTGNLIFEDQVIKQTGYFTKKDLCRIGIFSVNRLDDYKDNNQLHYFFTEKGSLQLSNDMPIQISVYHSDKNGKRLSYYTTRNIGEDLNINFMTIPFKKDEEVFVTFDRLFIISSYTSNYDAINQSWDGDRFYRFGYRNFLGGYYYEFPFY